MSKSSCEPETWRPEGRWLRWLLVLEVSFLGASGAVSEPVAPSQNAAIYSRTTVHFTNAVFYKPSERAAEQLAFRLAPLLIQEVRNPREHKRRQGTNAPVGLPKNLSRLGALTTDGGGVKLDFAGPAVYFRTDAIQVKSKAHARFAYFWCAGHQGEQPRSPAVQGVRLTLDSTGRPAVWEILHDPSGRQLIFVSESLEAAARAQFGPPLADRKHAVERPSTEAPTVVVARVIDDGPMPMGPILYLGGDAQRLDTLICRCMPAQATRLLETRIYDLLNADLDPGRALLERALKMARQPAFRPQAEDLAGGLESRLRIPEGF